MLLRLRKGLITPSSRGEDFVSDNLRIWHDSQQSRPGPLLRAWEEKTHLAACVAGRLCALLMVFAVLTPQALRAEDGRSSLPSNPSATSESPDRGESPNLRQGQAYFINPDDVLLIQAFDVPEVSREYRVSAAGTITLPLLAHRVTAAGLTPDQLAQVIAEKYRVAGLLSDPQITVAVKESRAYSIAITGAVKRPQIHPLFGQTTLLDVLSQAEGLADDAGNTAIITRGDRSMQILSQDGKCRESGKENGCSPTLSVDIRRLLDTGDPALNVDVFPGDRVTVQRAGIIYVAGAVNRPGGFPLRDDHEDMTVLKAVALAEGLKSTAVGKKAMIIRKDSESSGQRKEISVDLKKLLGGKETDPAMYPNDILFVPDSTGKKAALRGVEAAIQITTGLIIWRR
jgi:polysaccharide export outer membrane protein